MKALLVLAMAVAVSARPGFVYSVVDPGQGYAAAPANVYSASVTPNVQTVVTPNVYSSVMTPNMYASVMTPSMYTTPMVYNQYSPMVYQVSGCRNNDGQLVPCAGGDFAAPVLVQGQEKLDLVPVQQQQQQQVVAQPVSSGAAIVDVKKREAEPQVFYNAINQIQPLIYSQPMVYAASPVGCRNNEGMVVACVGEAEPVVEGRSVHDKLTRLEAAAEAAKVVAVKKREAEADPQFVYNTMPYTSPMAVTPNVYSQPQMVYPQPQMTYAQPQMTYVQPQVTYAQPQMTYAQPQMTYAQPQMTYAQPQMVYAQTPVVYQSTGGCRNVMGSIVPCALGDNFVHSVNTVVPAQQFGAPDVTVIESAASSAASSADTSAIISVKKREATSEPLYYGDTYRFPGYATPLATPTTYTVSAPMVSSISSPVSYVAATPYMAASPIIAAVQPGCRNEQGSIVPCA